MPNFISAYKLQQRDGLTRQRVIELAEIGPVYWVAKDEKKELYQSGVINGHFVDGFKRLQDTAIQRWTTFVHACESIKTTCENIKNTPVEKWRKKPWANFSSTLSELFASLREESDTLEKDSLIDPWENGSHPLDDEIDRPNKKLKTRVVHIYQDFGATSLRLYLAAILPNDITGREAYALFPWKQLAIFSQQPDEKFDIDIVLNEMNLDQLLYFSKTSTQAKLDENIWTYLRYEPSQFLDLIFKRIFTERLVFDADNSPRRGAGFTDNNSAMAAKIENALRLVQGLNGTKKRYCVALINRLKGETFETAYRIAKPDTTMTGQRDLRVLTIE